MRCRAEGARLTLTAAAKFAAKHKRWDDGAPELCTEASRASNQAENESLL